MGIVFLSFPNCLMRTEWLLTQSRRGGPEIVDGSSAAAFTVTTPAGGDGWRKLKGTQFGRHADDAFGFNWGVTRIFKEYRAT